MPEAISFRPASDAETNALIELQEKTGRSRSELLQEALTLYLGGKPLEGAQKQSDRILDLERGQTHMDIRLTKLEQQVARLQRFALGMEP